MCSPKMPRKSARHWHYERDVLWSSEGPAPESSVATITRAEALIAATGSLLSSSACAGREAHRRPGTHRALPSQSACARYRGRAQTRRREPDFRKRLPTSASSPDAAAPLTSRSFWSSAPTGLSGWSLSSRAKIDDLATLLEPTWRDRSRESHCCWLLAVVEPLLLFCIVACSSCWAI